MMRLATLCCIGVMASSSVAISAGTMFPVPPGAMKPEHVILQQSVAEQDYFWLNVPYPSMAAFDHYGRVFADWRACTSSQSGWESYADTANGANRFVHNVTRYWVTRENDRAVIAVLHYESKGVAHRERPDNDRQFVAVIQHRVPDAAAHLAHMNVVCPKALNNTVDTDGRAVRAGHRDTLYDETPMLNTLFPSNVYVRVNRNQFRLRHIESGTDSTVKSDTPFTTQRMLIGDFTVAERTLKAALKKVANSRLISVRPRILIQPLEMIEGGLSQVEDRVLHEVAIGAGASKVVVWTGPELTDSDVKRKLDGK